MNIILPIAAFALMTLCYLQYQRKKTLPAGETAWVIFYKGAATAVAAMLCAAHAPLNVPLLIGLILCTAADVVLCMHFLTGVALFGLAHVGYGTAFVLHAPPTWVNLIAFVVLAAALAALFLFKRKAFGKRALPYFLYGLVLCAMLALAVTQTPALLAGAALFVFSDALLLYNMTGHRTNKTDYVSLGAYYLAQYLIALSVWL